MATLALAGLGAVAGGLLTGGASFGIQAGFLAGQFAARALGLREALTFEWRIPMKRKLIAGILAGLFLLAAAAAFGPEAALSLFDHLISAFTGG